MTEIPPATPKLFLPDLIMTLFLRLVALGCLWYGLLLWGDLIGYGHKGALRFDLVGTDMKAANATLAVLYPVAAIGLWLRGAWGPVIWTAAAAMEIAMHQVLFGTFGYDDIKIAAIAATAFIYLVLRLVIIFRKPVRQPAAHG